MTRAAAALAVLLLGCFGDYRRVGGAPDAGGDAFVPADSMIADAGREDAGRGDAAGRDGGPTDAARPDALPADGPTCLEARAACRERAECCAGLECGMTSIGQVCCGTEGAACVTITGEDCCGDLLCVAGRCEPPACRQARTPCRVQVDCCAPLLCGTTSLGRVCCGNEGAPCATANGEDCCGALLCRSGRCAP